jgi:hypothetical protein
MRSIRQGDLSEFAKTAIFAENDLKHAGENIRDNAQNRGISLLYIIDFCTLSSRAKIDIFCVGTLV